MGVVGVFAVNPVPRYQSRKQNAGCASILARLFTEPGIPWGAVSTGSLGKQRFQNAEGRKSPGKARDRAAR